LKHLPQIRWPAADIQAFAAAFERGDLFDETSGSGAHLADGSRTSIRKGYSRWLGFLDADHPDELLRPPADRISPERVREFVEKLSQDMRKSSLAQAMHLLCYAARLIAGERDWRWLAAIKARLLVSSEPADRFDRLAPPCQTLDFGIELMENALAMPAASQRKRDLQYRDGLILALLSLWPIRRRSLAALTVNIDGDDMNLVLHPSDTKSKRSESFPVPAALAPYMKRYLKDILPRLLGPRSHEGLWASYRRGTLSAGHIYESRERAS
jgi:integrase/recombinase XerD